MSELLNKKVHIKKCEGNNIVKFKGDVRIIDKMLTNMAHYSKSPIINNAPMEVYIGRPIDEDGGDGFSIILFEPNDIIKVYF